MRDAWEVLSTANLPPSVFAEKDGPGRAQIDGLADLIPERFGRLGLKHPEHSVPAQFEHVWA
jgi:hypothetical protein